MLGDVWCFRIQIKFPAAKLPLYAIEPSPKQRGYRADIHSNYKSTSCLVSSDCSHCSLSDTLFLFSRLLHSVSLSRPRLSAAKFWFIRGKSAPDEQSPPQQKQFRLKSSFKPTRILSRDAFNILIAANCSDTDL